MEEATNIYYDVQGMGTPSMKYKRGNLLVSDHEYKNLTTYMRQLHEYYMAQATETGDFGFEVICPVRLSGEKKPKHCSGWLCEREIL